MTESEHNPENIIEQAVQRFVDAQLQGQKPDVDEFVKQYPDFESQIRQRLQNLDEIDSLFDCLMQADDSDFNNAITESNLIGQKLGDFEILNIVGQGGMGAVFLARQVSLDREVALKVISSVGGAQAKNLDRFKRESKVLAQISHPNIVPIYEVGQQGPYFYFAMEYVRGVSLDKILSGIRNAKSNDKASDVMRKCMEAQAGIYDNNLSEKDGSKGAEINTAYIVEISRIIVSIASALDYAHNKGILHRDIKPSNILIAFDGTAKLVDFGLAKGQTQETITITGEFFGTPSYVSPEQIRKPDTVDCRSDVFSLAATFYECLTLHPPFGGNTVNETLTHVISREVVPPKKYCPRLSTDFNTVLMHALEKLPDDRYPTAAAFADDIENLLEFKPITAKKPSITTRAYKTLRRNPLKVVVVGISILVIILGCFVFSNYTQKRNKAMARKLETIAIKYFRPGDYAESLTYFKKAIAQYPFDAAIYLEMGSTYVQLKQYPQAIEAFKQAIKIEPDNTLAIGVLAGVYTLQGRFEDALVMDEKIIEIKPDSQTYRNIGYLLKDMGRNEEAVEAFKNAIKTNPKDSHAQAYIDLGSVYFKLNLVDDAIKAFEKAKEIDPNCAFTYNNLGIAYGNLGRHQEAIEACKQAIRINPDYADAYCNLGTAYDSFGRYQDAIEACKQAIIIKPDYAEAHVGLGNAYGNLGRYEEAIDCYKQAIRIKPDYAEAHNNLGFTYGKLGRHQEAVESYKQAIRIEPDLAEAHYNLGIAYGKLGRYQDEIESYKQAIRIKPNYAEAHYNLGVAYGKLSRYQDAVEAYKQAIKIKPDDADAHYNLGTAYCDLGRYQDAVESFKQAIRIKPDDADAYYNLGNTYGKLGRYQDAIEAYKQAIRIKPDWAEAHNNLGRTYLITGDKGSALEEYKILKTMDAELANKLFNLINK